MSLMLILFQGSSFWMSILPFVAVFAVFYFLVILPQRKQQQKLKDMVASLKVGDEVVTNGGVIGKIVEVRDTSFIVRSANKSNIEIGKVAVVGRKDEGNQKG